MGLFRNIFWGAKTLLKTSFYVGTTYTFLSYFYVQEVKHRLEDTEETYQINKTNLKEHIQTLVYDKNDAEQYTLIFAMGIWQLYTFYARAWNFREFELTCKNFNQNVTRVILKNYEEYGIFKNRAKLEQSLNKNEVRPDILKKILEVKEVNAQLTSSATNLYLKIMEKQIAMSTGTILGLTKEEESRINLLYDYIERGLYISSSSQEEYWKYKLTQSEVKRHNYNDIIFKLLYI